MPPWLIAVLTSLVTSLAVSYLRARYRRRAVRHSRGNAAPPTAALTRATFAPRGEYRDCGISDTVQVCAPRPHKQRHKSRNER